MADKNTQVNNEKKDNLAGKRGKKGGTRYPNYSLKQIVPVLKDLISKTHSKPISIAQLNAGVFKLKPNSADGSVKYSSMKQYGLADGDYQNISSKELSSKIELATGEEKINFIREAFFNAASFKNAFETFQSSSVNKSKIKSYCVQTLGIHIDLADKFLKSFLESCELAKLCLIKGEDITFSSAKDLSHASTTSVENKENLDEDDVDNEDDIDEDEGNDDRIDESVEDDETDANGSDKPILQRQSRPKTNSSNIDLRIDSTLDPEKLAKQLKLLRKYGLI